jgi:hypothetical protein
MSELFEAIGVKAAGIDFSALAEEMGNVNAASSDTVEALARANDELDKAKQSATIFGATLLKALVIDPAERFGSFLGGAGFKTIKELEEIELRANAIAELTRQGLFSGDDTQKAILIADKMEEIQNRLKGNKNTTAAINEDLDTANNLEKEKTSQLERQQRLLEQQEAKRKESIKDAQFEVELIEAKLRGDKARVAALEEQRDFDRAFEQTDSFETAANVAAAKAAERAAQGAESSATSGGGARMAPPAPKTAQDYETEMRAAAAAARFSERASSLQERGFYGAAGRAMERADKAAQDVRDRADISKFLKEQYDAGTMGEAYEKYRRQTGMDRDSREEFEKRTREKALTDSERRAKDEERRSGEQPASQGGGGSVGDKPASEGTLVKILNKIQERPILVA